MAEKPEHYIANRRFAINHVPEGTSFKPLRGVLAGTRRAHIDPFVIIFELEEDTMIFHYVKHHDKAY